MTDIIIHIASVMHVVSRRFKLWPLIWAPYPLLPRLVGVGRMGSFLAYDTLAFFGLQIGAHTRGA